MNDYNNKRFFIKLFGYLDKSGDSQNFQVTGISLIMTYIGFLLGFLTSTGFELSIDVLTQWEQYPLLGLGIFFIVKARFEKKKANVYIEELKGIINQQATELSEST